MHKNLRSLPPKSSSIGLDQASKLGTAGKNEKFSRQLFMVDQGMDGWLSSRAIEWKWNHGDSTVESSRISSETHGLPSGFFTPPSPRTAKPTHA